MTAMEALMPTHAAISEAAGSPVVIPYPLNIAPASPVDPIRKFVIVRQDGAEHPVVFSRSLVHKNMVPPGTTPVSAGFVLVVNNKLKVLSTFESTTLHLKPRPQDEALLTAFLSHTSHESH